jgi:hypothetical protein
MVRELLFTLLFLTLAIGLLMSILTVFILSNKKLRKDSNVNIIKIMIKENKGILTFNWIRKYLNEKGNRIVNYVHIFLFQFLLGTFSILIILSIMFYLSI